MMTKKKSSEETNIFAAKQGDFSSKLALILFPDGLIWRGMDAALQMMKTRDAARL